MTLPAVQALNGRTLAYRQGAILWPPGQPDGFGGIEDGTPSFVQVRWEQRNVISLDAAGQEFTSEAIVYVGSAVEAPGGFIALASDVDIGESADLTKALGTPEIPADPDASPPVERVPAVPPDPAFVARLATARARAREIRALNVSPSLAATSALYKAII